MHACTKKISVAEMIIWWEVCIWFGLQDHTALVKD